MVAHEIVKGVDCFDAAIFHPDDAVASIEDV